MSVNFSVKQSKLRLYTPWLTLLTYHTIRVGDNNFVTSITNYDSIEIIERLLRELIHSVLSSKYGEDWDKLEEITPQKGWHIQLNKRREDEIRNTSSTRHFDLPIAYSDFSDLGKILEKNKDLFIPIFGDYDKYFQFYKTVDEIRNTVKHHRNIKPHQYMLLDGIAGEFEDIVARWKIGSPILVDHTEYQFRELIPISGQSKDLILADSKKSIENWGNIVIECFNKMAIFDTDNLIKITNEYECKIIWNDIEIKIRTSPNTYSNYIIDAVEYKSIYIIITWGTSSKASFDEFLALLNRPYLHINYHLVHNLNVNKLYEYGKTNAGLRLSSSGSGNNRNIEISILNGELRIGANQYSNVDQRKGGTVFATAGENISLWQFHNYIPPKLLIEFMLGDVAPRTLMHLFKLSQKEP